MENRYEKNVLEKEKVIPENYVKPPIPHGYKHICGEWYNGYVIEKISDGNQFVWVPVGMLDPDGTLDGINFTEKFGRRNYMNDCFSDYEFNEPLKGELIDQVESVKKYGGFYISRYDISKSPDGKPQSVKGAIPWIDLTFFEAKDAASTFECSEFVKSHLIYGAEYDSVLAWLIKSGSKTLEEITENSCNWGNYNEDCYPKILTETGSSEEWCANNIYDLAGNTMVWTQEEINEVIRVIRGGTFYSSFYYCPVANRECNNPYIPYYYTGFRVALYIK